MFHSSFLFTFHLCCRTCRVAPLLQCDYCPLLFHRDCMNPPITSLPTGRWMCPNHPEFALVSDRDKFLTSGDSEKKKNLLVLSISTGKTIVAMCHERDCSGQCFHISNIGPNFDALRLCSPMSSHLCPMFFIACDFNVDSVGLLQFS